MSRFLFCFFVLLVTSNLTAWSQGSGLIEIKGEIVDQTSGEPVSFAHISVLNEPVGIVANEEGKFSFFFTRNLKNDTIVFSALGYKNYYKPVRELMKKYNKIYLKDTTYMLEDIIIESIPANDIVVHAIKNIEENNSQEPFKLEGFYRNAFREDNRFVRLLEVALLLYDKGYSVDDGISVRYLQMRKSHDFREYKWKEGANYLASFFESDLVRNKQGSLQNMISKWDMVLEDITFFDDKEIYVIRGSLNTDPRIEKYSILLHIRKDDFAFQQVEYEYEWNPKYFRGFVTGGTELKRTNVFVKTIYREFRKKFYLSSQIRKAKWIIETDKEQYDGPSTIEIHDEMVINKITPKYKRQPQDQIESYGDLYKKVDKYNRTFWKKYNVPVDTEFMNALQKDLEETTTLDKQFRSIKKY